MTEKDKGLLLDVLDVFIRDTRVWAGARIQAFEIFAAYVSKHVRAYGQADDLYPKLEAYRAALLRIATGTDSSGNAEASANDAIGTQLSAIRAVLL